MVRLAIPTLDLSREYRSIGPLLRQAIEDVLAHQSFILGRQVIDFEGAAATRCAARHAIGCASGTDALWLALSAAGIGPGDCVLTTPFSFFATVSAILRTGAQPVFSDIDPRTFNLSPEAARDAINLFLTHRSKAAAQALNKRPAGEIKAILPVHLFGQTADWNGFSNLQRELSQKPEDLLLIEDAAQAFGAAWNSKPAGSLGAAAAFSFYPTKNLAACGDAGMVTTSDSAIARRVRLLRVHGMESRYVHEEVGWNSRLDTMQAAILLVKLQFIEAWNERRRQLAAHYALLFEKIGLAEPGPYPEKGVVLPWKHAEATHVFHQYVIRVRRRDGLKSFLEKNGVGSEIYYPVPLHLQRALAGLGYTAGMFPESERAAQEVIALPIFPQLTFEEQEIVVARVADFLSAST